MRLPNAERAQIPRAKLTDYLLSVTHPIGRSKARWFRDIGFDETNLEMLEQSLISIARSEDVGQATHTSYGTKYVIEGFLEAPNGTVVRLETAWIVEEGHDFPRFVTAYPAARGQEA